MTAGFEIINPTARVADAGAGTAQVKRVDSADGLRIGILDNGMPHAGEFLGHLGKALEHEHKAVVLTRRKAYTARSAEVELLDEIAANCDVAVTGFGV
jgi:hypothetical protein